MALVLDGVARGARDLWSVFQLGWLMALRPPHAIARVIEEPRSGPWLLVGFLVAELPFDREGFLTAVIMGGALRYFLAYRVVDLSARFLGGKRHHVELRWLGFLLLIPAATANTGALVLSSVLGFDASLQLLVPATVAIGLFELWLAAVFFFAITRIYDFSFGRALLLTALLPPWIGLWAAAVFAFGFQ